MERSGPSFLEALRGIRLLSIQSRLANFGRNGRAQVLLLTGRLHLLLCSVLRDALLRARQGDPCRSVGPGKWVLTPNPSGVAVFTAVRVGCALFLYFSAPIDCVVGYGVHRLRACADPLCAAVRRCPGEAQSTVMRALIFRVRPQRRACYAFLFR